MKYGKVAIVGRPNTGKSTLINAIMNQKVSITSPLPQTTRRAQTVLFSDIRGKILFTDTPGLIGKVVDLMSKRVNEEIPRELAKTDLVVAVVDISRPKNEEENKILGLLRKIPTKKIFDFSGIGMTILFYWSLNKVKKLKFEILSIDGGRVATFDSKEKADEYLKKNADKNYSIKQK